ncbi:hypothetical protein HAX54_026300, partial [Datura stramonium]|nr:hypothetical protein [Datura stramonium]
WTAWTEVDELKTGEKDESWTKMFTGNKAASNDMALNDITPDVVSGELVVEFEKS